jgi:molybdate transport system ATP-binding protein
VSPEDATPQASGLRLEAAVEERGFEVELEVRPGETVAVLGPNGAGKSTLLGVLSGLLRPTAGRAVLDGEVLFDLSARHWLPPYRRGVTLLAQEALLFPHLTARQNVEFGPRSRGRSRADTRQAGERWLAEVDALALADRRPAELSGGQAQRVAIARALASEPKLLLLDEPMAALDAHVTPALRRMLRDVLRGRTALIVTHDVLDALVLADRVLVIADGRIRADGPTREVLERPTDPFTAELASLNLLVGTAVASAGSAPDAVELPDGRRLPLVATGAPAGSAVGVAVPPSVVSVRVEGDRADAAGGFELDATVQDLEPRGDLVRVRTDTLVADLPPTAVADLDLTPGVRIRLSFDPASALVYPLPA